MARSSLLAAGPRLVASTTIKMFCLNLQDNQNYWDSVLGGKLEPREPGRHLGEDEGAWALNSVKVYFDGLTSGYFGGNGVPVRHRLSVRRCVQAAPLGFRSSPPKV